MKKIDELYKKAQDDTGAYILVNLLEIVLIVLATILVGWIFYLIGGEAALNYMVKPVAVEIMYILYRIFKILVAVLSKGLGATQAASDKKYIQELSRELTEQSCEVEDESNIKKVFTLSMNEIHAGEKIQDNKTYKIKDVALRIAADGRCSLQIAIDVTNGKTYEIATLRSGRKMYFEISYETFNKYIMYSKEAIDKYKPINSDNWKTFIN